MNFEGSSGKNGSQPIFRSDFRNTVLSSHSYASDLYATYPYHDTNQM
jgi:hypothetical protein